MARRPISTAAEAAADHRIRAFGVLLTTAGMLERLAGAVMERECGISHAMFEVLLHLAEHPEGLPMGDVSRRLVLTSGGATRLIGRMEAAGLVRREPSHEDRRSTIVSMTERGEQTLVDAARVHVRTLDEHVYQPLTQAEAAAMVSALDRLGTHAREVLPPLG
ncbi:MarR family transcriptional regulator [Streptomyces sp. RB6PN25]|uniref:MarR family transcriptional regulator n=1 Tax=Streptomyces humicola TaxID=2953240 RepID=A0ABT1Q520_9ACTN|nr:MarR family transcriptional regulator [Streptomyces humicola]MCQ4084984.1 MarR family transcriptional regulator [Streptomyces humicola]